MKKTNEYLITILFTAMIAVFGIAHIVLPDTAVSESERRSLAQFPEFSVESITDGSFMTNLEKYLPDQFPLREGFRSVKAAFEKLSGRLDVSDVYEVDGYLTKLDYTLNENSVAKGGAKFEKIRELLGCENAYLAVIPHKDQYMDTGAHPVLDFDRLTEVLYESAPNFTAIDITETLSLDSYYKTDTHWRQETLAGTVGHLTESMGLDAAAPEYEIQEIPEFLGVYAGQYALPVGSESIFYLTNDVLEQCTVSAIGAEVDALYTLDKLTDENSVDMYDIFLGGAVPLITIENPQAQTERELILVRDSFGSSIAPLLVPYYAKITMIDLRYIASQILPQYVDGTNADLLVLLSTGVIGTSEMLKVQ